MGAVILFVCFAAIGIAFSFGRKMLRMNKDRNQQQLASMFLAAARSSPAEGARISLDILAFMRAQGWDRVQALDRMAHAISMVNVMDPRAYNNALQVYQTLQDELSRI